MGRGRPVVGFLLFSSTQNSARTVTNNRVGFLSDRMEANPNPIRPDSDSDFLKSDSDRIFLNRIRIGFFKIGFESDYLSSDRVGFASNSDYTAISSSIPYFPPYSFMQLLTIS